MPTSVLTPPAPARKRLRRTRTRTISTRPALALSELELRDLDFGRQLTVVCPDCSTWVPATGTTGRNPKLVPHHDRPADTPGARRCPGSNRRLVLDVSETVWLRYHRRAADAIEPATRRGTTLIKRGGTAPPPAVVQLRRRHPRGPEQHHHRHAADQLTAHRRACRTCTPVPAPGSPVVVTGPCAVGRQLQQQAAAAQRTYTTRAAAPC